MKICRNIKGQRGVTAIVVAIVLPVLIAVVALAVDVGYLAVTKNELQNIADASALAGARQLGSIYQTMSYEDQQIYVCDPAPIKDMAKEIASKNRAGGKDNIIINDGDIIIGDWDGGTQTLTATLNQPDAVEVTARRDGGANGPIVTFFARIFGIDTEDVVADATAALTGQSTAEPGELELPVGISRYWFDSHPGDGYCGEAIKFYPTNDPDSCAGWNTFTYEPSNDAKVRKILNKEEGYESPETISGKTDFEFIGGTLSQQTFEALLTLFQENGYDIKNEIGDYPHEPVGEGDTPIPLFNDDTGERLLYPDGTERNKHEWETTVVVYDSDDCTNPNQSQKILGFARIVMFDVLGAPSKLIRAMVVCKYVDIEDSRGGGGEYGTMGSIPGLVE